MAEKKKTKNMGHLLVHIFNFGIWALFGVALVFISNAQPEKQTFLEDKWGKTARATWLYDYLDIALILAITGLVIGVIGLFVNIIFASQKQVKISKGMVIGLFIDAFLLLFLGINFYL